MSFQVFGLNYIFSIILSPGSLGIGIFWHIKTHGCGCHPHNPSSQGAVVEGICYCNICCISSVWCLWSQNLQIDMKLCKNMSSKERMARWKDLGFTWNLHIGWRCTVSAIFNLCVCWSFAPLQLVALLLQSPGGGIPSGAAQMSAVVTSFLSFCTAGVYQSGQPWLLLRRYNCGFLNKHVSWRAQAATQWDGSDVWWKRLEGRLWKVRYVCRAGFSVKSWPKLDFWVFFGGGEKMCWCTVSSCRMFSSHPKWHLNTFDDSIPKGTFCTGWAECPLDSRFFSLRKLTIHRNIEEWRDRNL